MKILRRYPWAARAANWIAGKAGSLVGKKKEGKVDLPSPLAPTMEAIRPSVNLFATRDTERAVRDEGTAIVLAIKEAVDRFAAKFGSPDQFMKYVVTAIAYKVKTAAEMSGWCKTAENIISDLTERHGDPGPFIVHVMPLLIRRARGKGDLQLLGDKTLKMIEEKQMAGKNIGEFVKRDLPTQLRIEFRQERKK
jgi:hypothetical protein